MTCVIDGEREPLRDEHGQPWLTCGPCAGRTRHALREIPDLMAELDGLASEALTLRDQRAGTRAVRVPDPADAARKRTIIVREPGHHADPVAALLPGGPTASASNGPRVSGSTTPSVPAQLDAVDLAAGARAGSLAVADRTAWPEDQIGHLPVATELEFWVRDLAEVRGEGVPLPNVADLCGWLLDRLDDACRDWPPIDEMAPKIWAVHGALRSVLGLVDVPEYKQGVACPKCFSLDLWRANGSGWIECGTCPAVLSETEYREWTVEAAAEARGVA